MKKIRIIACILLAATLCTLLAGCADSPTVMTVGGESVSYDMLRYFVMNYKTGYEGIEPEDFANDEELKAELVKNTNASISELVAYKLLAKEYGIKLTDEQKESIDKEVEALAASYDTEEAYKADLEANYITEAVYRDILESSAYCDSLYDYLTDEYTGIFRHDDATIMGDIEAGNFFSAEYIYVNYGLVDYEEKKAFAQGLCDRIKNGELMSKVYAEYENEYLLVADYVKLDAFTYSEENAFFEEAVLSLEIGECSDLLEMSGKFIIVKRLALDDEYIDKHFYSIIASYLSREFFNYVSDYADSLEIKMKKKYEDLEYCDIK